MKGFTRKNREERLFEREAALNEYEDFSVEAEDVNSSEANAPEEEDDTVPETEE